MKKIISLLLIILLSISCTRVPVTNRAQFRMLPESMILSMSLTAYKDFMKQNPALPLSNNNAMQVKIVGDKMGVAVNRFLRANGHRKIAQQSKWEYQLVNNNAVNAFCMPGGKIVFFNGIMPLAQDESGIATIMGHEMAHAVARHGNERLSQQLAVALGGVSLAIAMRDKPEQTRNLFLAVYGVGGTLGTLAYSRKHEYEADKLGMVFMAISGYDPAEAIKFWERMEQHQRSAQVPQFLSTHPHHSSRITEMKKFLPKAKKYLKN